MSNGDDEPAEDPDDVDDDDAQDDVPADESDDALDDEPDGAPDQESDEDAPDDEAEAGGDDGADAPGEAWAEREALAAEFDARLDDVEAALEVAETEADLDEVEADLDAVEAEIEETDFPEPGPEGEAAEEDDGDDEEEREDPVEALEDRIDGLRSDLEDQRGPYAEDVQSGVSGSAGTIRTTRWTEEGEPEVRAAVESFLQTANEQLGTTVEPEGEDLESYADSLERVGEAATEGGEPHPDGLHPDEDAGVIAALLEAIDQLEDDLEDTHEWGDLTVAEQLRREGFYDRLVPENSKDFPPERNVIRIAEREGDVERILLAFEHLDSEFTQENCVDALKRLGREAQPAFDAMHQQAQRRQVGPIQVLGKIGDERAVDTLVDFVDGGNVPVQKVAIRALGEIGSEEATQAVANALVDEEPSVRTRAARALGLIGDTRAIEPLSDVLGDEEAESALRAAAAWALVQIGTERALEAAAEYHDDRAYIVQAQAEKAREVTSA